MKAHPEYKYQPRKPYEVKRRNKKPSESPAFKQIDN